MVMELEQLEALMLVNLKVLSQILVLLIFLLPFRMFLLQEEMDLEQKLLLKLLVHQLLQEVLLILEVDIPMVLIHRFRYLTNQFIHLLLHL